MSGGRRLSKGNIAFAAAAVMLAAFVVFFRNPSTDARASFDGEPELVAATFSSAWCAACKILEPRMARVIPDFAGEPVKFVKLDFTFGQHKDLRELAVANGLEEPYDRFRGATGFTLLIDRDTGEIIDTLTSAYSEKAMGAALRAALAVAERTPPQTFTAPSATSEE